MQDELSLLLDVIRLITYASKFVPTLRPYLQGLMGRVLSYVQGLKGRMRKERGDRV